MTDNSASAYFALSRRRWSSFLGWALARKSSRSWRRSPGFSRLPSSRGNSPAGRRFGPLVVFTALLPAAYGAPHLLSFAERFAIPRPFDEALVLAGLAALAAGRDAVCLGCLLAAAFLHPIMAPAGFGVFVAVLGLEDKRWFWFCTFAGALLVLAGALGLPLTDRLFTAIDPSLKSLHESRSRFCFQAFGQPKVFRRSSFRQRPSPLPRISSKGAAGGSLRPP
jgi:hypothetical protein